MKMCVFNKSLFPKPVALMLIATATMLLSGCMSMQSTYRMPMGAGRPNIYANGSRPNQQRVAHPPATTDSESAAVDVLPAPPGADQLSLADEPLLPAEEYESFLGPSLTGSNGPELVTPFSVQQTDDEVTAKPKSSLRDEVPIRDLQVKVKANPVNRVRSRVPFHVVITNPSDAEIPDVVIEAGIDDQLSLPGRTEKRVLRNLGTLKPNESRTITLTLTSRTAGRFCTEFTLSVAGKEAVWKSYCVDFR